MADELSKSEREALLKRIRTRYDEASEHWQPIFANGAVNMRYVSGDPWDPAERMAREAAGRPCISLDEINQHTNQVINDVRSNRRGVKFSPTGRGANDKTAEFYQDKMREIEYRSQAQIVYTTAFQNAVERGYGACRVKTKYVPGTFVQEIWLEEFVNPDCVLPDPNAKRSHTLDKKYCFVQESRDREEFKREFGDAKIVDFTPDVIETAKAWFGERTVTIAEYWEVQDREKSLHQVQRGRRVVELYDDELEVGDRKRIIDTRLDVVPYVCAYWTNGVEILRPKGQRTLKTEWGGQYIPIVTCFGKVIYLTEGGGSKRKIQGMTDLMRDPQMIYAFLRTNECEHVGMTPKTPFVGYEGQFRGHEGEWANVNKVPQPFLQAKATTETTGNQILPLPQRQPYDPPVQALEILAESAIRSIRSAAGSTPLPGAAARRSEKSGVALKRIEDLSKVGSYHLVDHYNDMIEGVGIVCEDIFETIYDTAREVAVRRQKGAQEETERVRINDPSAKDGYPSIQGDHQVTVSTGPSFENEQEAGSDLADSLMGLNDPEILRAVLPMAVKLKNQGPIGDELVEMLELLQPPPVQQWRDSKKQGAPYPRQLMMQLSQSQERIQMAEAAIQELSAEANGKKLDAETKLRIADLNARVDMEKTRMDNATRIFIAEINARTKGVESAHADEHEAAALAHEHAEAEADRAQERALVVQQQATQFASQAAGMDAEGAEAERQRAFEAEQAQAAADAAASRPDA
jgi:hypothetical protein